MIDKFKNNEWVIKHYFDDIKKRKSDAEEKLESVQADLRELVNPKESKFDQEASEHAKKAWITLDSIYRIIRAVPHLLEQQKA